MLMVQNAVSVRGRDIWLKSDQMPNSESHQEESHFLAATLDFTPFFTLAFLGAALFFYSLAVLVQII